MKVEPSCAGNRIAIKKIFAYRQTEHPGEVPGALFLCFDQHSQMANEEKLGEDVHQENSHI